MTPPIEQLDPSLRLGDALIGARELADNLMPTILAEEHRSSDSAKLALFARQIHRMSFIGDEKFVETVQQTPDAEPEVRPIDTLSVLVAIDGLEFFVGQRREERRNHLQAA